MPDISDKKTMIKKSTSLFLILLTSFVLTSCLGKSKNSSSDSSDSTNVPNSVPEQDDDTPEYTDDDQGNTEDSEDSEGTGGFDDIKVIKPVVTIAPGSVAAPGVLVLNMVPASTEGILWKLSYLHFLPVGISYDIKRTVPKIKFESPNKVNGSLGCNNFSGKLLKNKDGSYKVTNIISTRMACQDLIEGYFSDLLRDGFTLSVARGRLNLKGKLGRQELLFVFNK